VDRVRLLKGAQGVGCQSTVDRIRLVKGAQGVGCQSTVDWVRLVKGAQGVGCSLHRHEELGGCAHMVMSIMVPSMRPGVPAGTLSKVWNPSGARAELLTTDATNRAFDGRVYPGNNRDKMHDA
jgi:hypothetical protein